jgi:hypothetical protein
LAGKALIGAEGADDGKSRLTSALPQPEGALHGFPAMLDSSGKKIADGDFSQWLEGEHLHVKISYDFGGGHRIEEKGVFRQQPVLVQEKWSWQETNNNQLVRQYEVNFQSNKATAEKLEEGGFKRWAEEIKVQPGRTFAGFGFTLAIKASRARLVRGEKVELEAVGFTPKPREIGVEISYGGVNEMEMGQRKVTGERFVIHPKVPLVAKAFVEVHDQSIWLTLLPSAFLRWEGPLVEQTDALMRVDLLPGEHSRSATAAPSGARSK